MRAKIGLALSPPWNKEASQGCYGRERDIGPKEGGGEGRGGEDGEGWEGGSQQVETTDRHTPLVLKEWIGI